MSDWFVLIGAPLAVAYVVYLFVFSPGPGHDSHRERWQELVGDSRYGGTEEDP